MYPCRSLMCESPAFPKRFRFVRDQYNFFGLIWFGLRSNMARICCVFLFVSLSKLRSEGIMEQAPLIDGECIRVPKMSAESAE
jgi:hypothetical protein